MLKHSTAILKKTALVQAMLITGFSGLSTFAIAQSESAWQQTLDEAKGQSVYFNAWGGSDTINDYISWAAAQVKKQYQVDVKQVKVTDAGDVVSRILAEKSANRETGGSVDLIWINGENFKAMKDNQLLAKAYTQKLPNYALVDTVNKPSTLYDFSIPVDNLEAPWGMAQLVFMHDTKRLATPPTSMLSLLETLKTNKGRFSYPALPNFHGTTFIKQALHELIADPALLNQPVSEVDFEKVSAPLWAYLDQLHPLLWRSGKSFPKSAQQMKQLLNDSELFISLSFNPNDASNAIANDELPDTVRTYVHKSGTLGNTHFIAIPFNANAKAGAQVFANFLMSPQAQLKKATPAVWGDPTVLAMNKLDAQQQQAFSQLKLGIATLSSEQLGKVLLEPHSSWVAALEKAWIARYAN